MPDAAPAVVLVSGGLDSCVCAAIAARARPLAFLHLNYQQLTQERELAAFHSIADHYDVTQRLVVDVGFMQQIGGSSLVDPSLPVPLADATDASVPSTYVPFRNANLLGIGVAWAEVLQADAVYIGAHEADSAYPDCRGRFFTAYSAMAALGTATDRSPRIATPLLHLDKAAIVRRGLALGAPLEHTWSCYQDQERACGRCHSCRLRLQGFAAAGAPDPIPYAEAVTRQG